jgi:ABC-type proline/glycine betaine transport system permease subunit
MNGMHTWSQQYDPYGSKGYGQRIDHFVVSKGYLEGKRNLRVSAMKVHQGLGSSDHWPITLDFTKDVNEWRAERENAIGVLRMNNVYQKRYSELSMHESGRVHVVNRTGTPVFELPVSLNGSVIGNQACFLDTGSPFSIYNPDVGALNIFLMQIGVIDSPIAFLSNPEWAMPAVILATIWKGFPFWTIMFLAALQSVPKELHEAAATDGCNAVQRFRNVSLPGIRPVILIVFMISTITTINSFEAIWLTTGGGPGSATTILPIFAYKSLTAFQIGQSAAAALALVPVLFVLVFFVMKRLNKDK